MPNPGEDSGFSWTGNYRAKVIDAKDPEYQGRVKIWCPDTMPEIDDDKGIWARPANNPLGGRNVVENGSNHHYQGTCYIPPVGSWVYIFFEYNDPTEPRYFAAGDFGQSKVPIENQQGDEYYNKTTIFKSNKGRTIIVSDDPHDERVEITGKKRKLSGDDVSGNPESVYDTQDNQTIILLNERDGEEQILIKDHKGNFINFDIDNQELHISFTKNIRIKSGKSIFFEAADNIELLAHKNINITANNNMNIDIGDSLSENIGGDCNIKVNGGIYQTSTSNSIHFKASGTVNIDASKVSQQSSTSISSSVSGIVATPPEPNGERIIPGSTQGPEDELPVTNPIVLPTTLIISDIED